MNNKNEVEFKPNKQNLIEAKRNKNDEYYTQKNDIELELKNYKHLFENKTVLCNCDDPEWSQFYIFFKSNMQEYKIKKLISTHYTENDLYDKSYKLECVILEDIEGSIKETREFLTGNGDFRSKECIELLKQSDIVCTNPPFSLFREYISQIIEYKKKFLIIGNTNAITYKEVFKLIKNNELWLGVSPRSMTFRLGEKGTKIVNAVWFTNLEHNKRKEFLCLNEVYLNTKYQKYDNHDAIEISKVKEIPINYEGLMGVPITFLEKHNPNQFEIVGFRKGNDGKDLKLNNKDLYCRILIKHIWRRKKTPIRGFLFKLKIIVDFNIIWIILRSNHNNKRR